MKTLIELYDERPLENVLGTEMFRPEETIFICPAEVAKDENIRESLKHYFKHRGISVRLSFIGVNMMDAGGLEQCLRETLSKHEDCTVDISGGTDAALFAAGSVSGDAAVITYSHNKNRFFEIKNAPFARGVLCTVKQDAESCFLMAGGTLLPGREDNRKLADKGEEIEKLYEVYVKYRSIWNRQISYIQRISSANDEKLQANGERTVKADNRHIKADSDFLEALERKGLIRSLSVTDKEVSFLFPDEIVRFWLRDVGSVLELHVYQACLVAGCFDDVVLSAVVNWNDKARNRDTVTNEIDVMAISGVHPVFISCKTSEIHTEALNELAILRDRFGGKGSRAMIVTSAPASQNRSAAHNRANELGIEVVEWRDLSMEHLVSRLRSQKAFGR